MAVLFPSDPGTLFNAFVAERHLATLTLVRPNGRPHTTPVGFTWFQGQAAARVITWSGSAKARMLNAGPLQASICQVDRGRWLTIEGVAEVTGDREVCEEAISAYAVRYRPPKDRGDERRTILIVAHKILTSAGLGYAD